MNFVHLLIQESDELEKAIDDYNKAISLNPKSTEAYVFRGETYSKLADHKKAIADFTNAIKLDPKNIRAFRGRAAAYCMLNQYQNAIDDSTKAIDLDPQNASLYEFRAFAYDKLGKSTLAEKDKTRATVEHSNLGVALGPKGAWGESIEEHERVVKAEPDNKAFRTNLSSVYLRYGDVLFGQKQYLGASKMYRKALDADPENKPAKENLDRVSKLTKGGATINSDIK